MLVPRYGFSLYPTNSEAYIAPTAMDFHNIPRSPCRAADRQNMSERDGFTLK
jgi:hypothetical protein